MLAQHWMELVPLSNFPAVQQIVRKAIGADYDDERISSALDTLAAEGRSLTTETLRVALDGPPAVSRNGHRPYKNPPASAYTES